DRGKLGKTERGNIWLDPNKTSPYQFYQFWLNATDKDARKWIRIFTFLSKKEIGKVILEHKKNPEERVLQRKLAEEVSAFVHGSATTSTTIQTTQRFFEDRKAPVENLSISDLRNMADSHICLYY